MSDRNTVHFLPATATHVQASITYLLLMSELVEEPGCLLPPAPCTAEHTKDIHVICQPKGSDQYMYIHQQLGLLKPFPTQSGKSSINIMCICITLHTHYDRYNACVKVGRFMLPSNQHTAYTSDIIHMYFE